MAAKIKKKDKVIVLSGKDKGKIGEVLQVMPQENKVVVQGVRVIKKHQRATALQQAGFVEKEAPIPISNVAYLDPKTNKPARVGFKTLSDGRKVRFAKTSGEQID